jgi:hypothetical protein
MIQCALSNNFCLLRIFTILANRIKYALRVVDAAGHFTFGCIESVIETMDRALTFFVGIGYQFGVSIQ